MPSALIAEDEPLLAESLKAALAGAWPELEIAALAQNGVEALEAAARVHPDVAFLDIRMPGLDGLELARVLERFAHPPEIVFVTAYESHAVEAFELAAVDYLLKPVRPERLADAVRRLGGSTARSGGEESVTRIAVDTAGRIHLVDRDAIHFVEASGDYVRLHTAQGTYLLRKPISTLEEAWREAGFVRIHRQFLVALGHVTEVALRSGGGSVAVVAGQELPVSRRHARDLRDVLARSPWPGRPAP
jgi:DNA-binding LytR/AlgR family response regulator